MKNEYLSVIQKSIQIYVNYFAFASCLLLGDFERVLPMNDSF